MEQQTPRYTWLCTLDSSQALLQKSLTAKMKIFATPTSRRSSTEHLKEISIDRQVIIIEKTDPPDDVRILPNA